MDVVNTVRSPMFVCMTLYFVSLYVLICLSFTFSIQEVIEYNLLILFICCNTFTSMTYLIRYYLYFHVLTPLFCNFAIDVTRVLNNPSSRIIAVQRSSL